MCLISVAAVNVELSIMRIWFSVDPLFVLEITLYNISVCFKLSMEPPLLFQM